MPIVAWVLLYLAVGVVTAFVIMFLSNLKSWDMDAEFIPAFIVMWPFCILFGILILFISWINNTAKKAADAFEDWRYRMEERLSQMRKDEKDGSST